VCDGYSELMMRLGRSVGLKIEKVSGYAKGYGYTKGQVDLIPDHAWNTVQIDGAWYLLDPTWDAGYVTYDTKSFLKKTDNYTFFLPDPNRFITSHLPEQQKWQLTPQPVSKQEFWAMPNLM
jgi:transglutaminase/protease-like cytokinesis protein 3